MNITTYIVYKNHKLICGNCRLEMHRLRAFCPFCGGLFANYETVLSDLFRDYENGYLTLDQIYDIINLENVKGEQNVEKQPSKMGLEE